MVGGMGGMVVYGSDGKGWLGVVVVSGDEVVYLGCIV